MLKLPELFKTPQKIEHNKMFQYGFTKRLVEAHSVHSEKNECRIMQIDISVAGWICVVRSRIHSNNVQNWRIETKKHKNTRCSYNACFLFNRLSVGIWIVGMQMYVFRSFKYATVSHFTRLGGSISTKELIHIVYYFSCCLSIKCYEMPWCYTATWWSYSIQWSLHLFLSFVLFSFSSNFPLLS